MNAYIFSAKTRLGTFLSNIVPQHFFLRESQSFKSFKLNFMFLLGHKPAGYRYFIAALDLPLAVAFGMYVYLCINAPSDNRIKPTIVSFTVLAFLALLSAGYFETTMRSVYISAYLRAVQIRNRRNQRRSRNTNTPTNTNANVESSYVDNYSNPPVANPSAMPSRSAVDEPPTAPMDPPPYDDDDDDDVKPLVP
ncbi:uncharacterized protein TRIADDRAFT_58217 [Trichoplax adhaerens]|uniref:Uncharacterized protein n=1 Tax=Trichoplax adhaerens TaxID=10228 RepID=B3S169_TRIAD|nr:predicted protein [Trichoplax adhaerens]EDV23187.1 predicted protein [Trichoplax adhaerens]|eukprot:XP_002114097.1 predicted protein [Trichoplax adhaerens]